MTTLFPDKAPTPTRIDAHHHLWRFTAEEYGWISDEMSALRRDFLVDELRSETAAACVSGTVAVQARQTVGETAWLLELATKPDSPVAGVVGWLPISHPKFEHILRDFLPNQLLKGLRHVVQGEEPGFLDVEAFNRGILALRNTELTYDILIFAQQIQEATRFIDRHPEQVFVLDHIAKPNIRHGEIADWSSDIQQIAKRPNVTCKISGMVTEADPLHWKREQLTPYFEVVLEAFGPQRLMIGTDWPVLTVGCTYTHWWQTVESWITGLSADEQAAMLGGTAKRVYRLQPKASRAEQINLAGASA